MPVFTIKAKDRLAVHAVAAYRALCERHGLGEQATEVSKALVEMAEWRRRHPDLIHLPDHPHVPATAVAEREPERGAQALDTLVLALEEANATNRRANAAAENAVRAGELLRQQRDAAGRQLADAEQRAA